MHTFYELQLNDITFIDTTDESYTFNKGSLFTIDNISVLYDKFILISEENQNLYEFDLSVLQGSDFKKIEMTNEEYNIYMMNKLEKLINGI